MSTTAQYLKTLNRIPDDIVLSMATREIEPTDFATCICGWAIREAMTLAEAAPAEDVSAPWFPHEGCLAQFGGGFEEWKQLYVGIYREPAEVELAFVHRVDAAVRRAS